MSLSEGNLESRPCNGPHHAPNYTMLQLVHPEVYITKINKTVFTQKLLITFETDANHLDFKPFIRSMCSHSRQTATQSQLPASSFHITGSVFFPQLSIKENYPTCGTYAAQVVL